MKIGFPRMLLFMLVKVDIQCYCRQKGLTKMFDLYYSNNMKNYMQLFIIAISYEPPRGKTNNVVFEQVRHKPAFTVTEKS